jgi:hypothetical protein
MSSKLRQFLIESYFGDREFLTRKVKKDISIQIDDQDDNDNLAEFCNIFVTIIGKERYEVDLLGRIPLTRDVIDLVETYNGVADSSAGRIILVLTIDQVGALTDLGGKIRETSDMEATVNIPGWRSISARTADSLDRFVRTIREYSRSKKRRR